MEAEGGNPLELGALLELENDSGFVELVCPRTGIPVWPSIRNEVIRLLLGDLLFPRTPIIDLRRRVSVPRIATGAFRAAAASRASNRAGSDILIVASGAGLVPRSGKLFNRLADPFADLLGDRAWTFESLDGDRWPSMPRWNRRLTFLAVDRLRTSLASRMPPSARSRSVAIDLVQLVANRARAIGWDLGLARRAYLQTEAIRRVTEYPSREARAHQMFDGSGARLALVEDASFGYRAVMNWAATDRGLHVAEYQHGMITRGHDGYNAHPRLTAHPTYRKTLPRTLLTYGPWWNSQTNLPVAARAIGNPYRTDALATWKPDAIRDKIIVLGDGIATDTNLAICRRLTQLLPAWRVRFRPHPLERLRIPEDPGGVLVDLEPDLYQSFVDAGAVLGEYSTALFEAVGLVPKVGVWDTRVSRFYLGAHQFPRLATVEDVPRLLHELTVDEAFTQSLWEVDWRTRFATFVAEAENDDRAHRALLS